MVIRSEETIGFNQPKDLPGIEIISIRNSPQCWKVFHKSYTVCTVLHNPGRGISEWIYRNKINTTNGRDVMLMEPGEAHVTKKVHGLGDFEVLQIPAFIIEEIIEEQGDSGQLHWGTATLSHPPLFHAFKMFHQSIQENRGALEEQSRLIHGLRIAMTLCGERRPPIFKNPGKTGLRRARALILDRHADPLSLAELAQIAGLSRFHFLRAFSQEYGLPPHAFQNQVRLAHARELLSNGCPPSQLNLGFSDQSHFIRLFKKSFGTTPSCYKKMLQAA